MLDRLIDFLVNIYDKINPFVIVSVYQKSVVLRFGKFKAVWSEGLHYKFPFIDEVITQHVIITTMTLPAQSLVTQDGENIVVKGMVKYKVADVQTFCLEVFDNKDAISDISCGIIKEILMSKLWSECIHKDIDNDLTKKIRSAIKRWGIEVEQVTLTDIAKIKTIRLINEATSTII